ncbi:hypothetical protein [Lactococcus hircilactis]|uniref:hypothetical protein n=1 Tax=Lactococcus hircilactis TaxID=1494462 RepID=UPI003FA2F647
MKLEADKEKLTIMGVKFANKNDFDTAAYAISTNMIEGWKPKVKDVEHIREKIVKTFTRA